MFQFSKQGHILRLLQAHPGKSQKVQPVVLKLGHLLLAPLAGIAKIRLEIIDDRAYGGAISGAQGPQVRPMRLRNPAEHGESLQVECRVRERAGTDLLARGAAVGADLAGEDAVAIVVEGRPLGGGVFDERRHGGHLHRPPGSVIVAAPPFVDAVLAMCEPLQVLFEPPVHGGLVLGVPGAGLSQELHALNGTDQDAAIEDSGGPAGVHVGDGLGVFQAGVHACFRIDEPGVDHARGALGIAGVVQIKSGGAERKDRVAHGIESRPVGGEAVGVDLTIAAEVRAAGVGGVGPPVGGFAVVVVGIEVHAFGPLGSHRPGAFPHAPVGVGAQAPHGILRPGLLADDGAVDRLGFILRD